MHATMQWRWNNKRRYSDDMLKLHVTCFRYEASLIENPLANAIVDSERQYAPLLREALESARREELNALIMPMKSSRIHR